jgi:hypothetical protein
LYNMLGEPIKELVNSTLTECMHIQSQKKTLQQVLIYYNLVPKEALLINNW